VRSGTFLYADESRVCHIHADTKADGSSSLKASLESIQAKLKEGGYKATPLSDVCPKVQKMVL
jgi:hypothetical protein